MTGIAYSLKKDITFLYFNRCNYLGGLFTMGKYGMVCYVSFGLWYIALSLDCDDAAL